MAFFFHKLIARSSVRPPQQAEMFRTMPVRAKAILFVGIGSLFAAVGVCNDLFNLNYYDVPHLVIAFVSSALFSCLWAWLAFKHLFSWMALVGVLQWAFYSVVGNLYPRPSHPLPAEQLQIPILLHAGLITVFIILGYTLMVGFVRMEGKRYFAAHTEIELASAIQRELVPPVSLRSARFEAYGRSLPSGVVGGDLLDIVSGRLASFAYVADVSGHGVKAGVLMSMIKASMRTRFAVGDPQPDGLLEALNDVLQPLTDAQSYATFAFIAIGPDSTLHYSLAGHLPIFHYEQSTGLVHHCSVENFPIGMFPGARFATSHITAKPGDLLAIFTDGLTEVESKRGEEIGFVYMEDALCRLASQPLPEIAESIFQTSQTFGTPADDRTLLLIRLA